MVRIGIQIIVKFRLCINIELFPFLLGFALDWRGIVFGRSVIHDFAEQADIPRAKRRFFENFMGIFIGQLAVAIATFAS